MPRSPKIRHFPRISARFPELSTPESLEIRRQPDVARRRFRSIRQHLQPLGALDGLALTQRVELIALVSRLHGYADQVRVERWLRSELRKAKREAPSRASNVKKKLQHIADALNHLADHVEFFEREYWGQVLLGLGDTQLSPDERIPVAGQLRDEAQRFLKMRLLTRREVESWEAAHSDDEVTVAAVRNRLTLSLFSFFAERAGMSHNESNKRTTRIINALLGGQLNEVEPEGRDQRPGSETVRTRVRRSKK